MYVIVHLFVITTTVYVQHSWPFLRPGHDLRTQEVRAQKTLRSGAVDAFGGSVVSCVLSAFFQERV
jgi:hypothetical protein